jgi:hypothetical protein
MSFQKNSSTDLTEFEKAIYFLSGPVNPHKWHTVTVGTIRFYNRIMFPMLDADDLYNLQGAIVVPTPNQHL